MAPSVSPPTWCSLRSNVTYFGAFIAGVLSFIGPSVLPLIPGYLSFVSLVSLNSAKRQVIITALFFVVGFSLVFVGFGASATAVGRFMTQQSTLFGKIAGVLLIIFGLQMIGVFKIPFLRHEARAMIVGISFAFGWTPSISPTLASILAVAAQQDSVNQGIALLSIYSLGLAIPFLLTALAIHQLFVAFSKIRHHHHTIEIVSGLLMIVTGVLIFTNRVTIIAQSLSSCLPTF